MTDLHHRPPLTIFRGDGSILVLLPRSGAAQCKVCHALCTLFINRDGFTRCSTCDENYTQAIRLRPGLRAVAMVPDSEAIYPACVDLGVPAWNWRWAIRGWTRTHRAQLLKAGVGLTLLATGGGVVTLAVWLMTRN